VLRVKRDARVMVGSRGQRPLVEVQEEVPPGLPISGGMREEEGALPSPSRID